ncbi:E3 ubiquitin-protein ligase XIAP-like [Bombus flavifrons]|uniref:E3 ubiquitin-protein ligase XIAP-like n=1 Tax=Bombus flavifrons TaxID=103934 RepID=UPI0037039EF0
MELQLSTTAKCSCLGLGRTKSPVHPEYASYDARLHTFATWPKSIPQRKEQLADAGFYYIGKGDQTFCYYCGVGLKDWEPENDPWEQHAKWFSKCCYLLMVQGQDYVNKITGQDISPLFKEETVQIEGADSVISTDKSNTDKKANLKEIIALKEENRKLKEARLCKICMDREIAIVFLPCGHLATCAYCASSLTYCLMCRQEIKATVRTFLS